MHTKQRSATTLSHEQLDRLAVRLADQEQFRAQQVDQLTAWETRPTSAAHEQIRQTLLAGALTELASTQAARRRLRDGTFGRCASCDGQLDLEQLDALPHSRHCLSCLRPGAV